MGCAGSKEADARKQAQQPSGAKAREPPPAAAPHAEPPAAKQHLPSAGVTATPPKDAHAVSKPAIPGQKRPDPDPELTLPESKPPQQLEPPAPSPPTRSTASHASAPAAETTAPTSPAAPDASNALADSSARKRSTGLFSRRQSREASGGIAAVASRSTLSRGPTTPNSNV